MTCANVTSWTALSIKLTQVALASSLSQFLRKSPKKLDSPTQYRDDKFLTRERNLRIVLPWFYFAVFSLLLIFLCNALAHRYRLLVPDFGDHSCTTNGTKTNKKVISVHSTAVHLDSALDGLSVYQREKCNKLAVEPEDYEHIFIALISLKMRKVSDNWCFYN